MHGPESFEAFTADEVVEGLLHHPEFHGFVVQANWNPLDPEVPKEKKVHLLRSGPFLDPLELAELLERALAGLKDRSS